MLLVVSVKKNPKNITFRIYASPPHLHMEEVGGASRWRWLTSESLKHLALQIHIWMGLSAVLIWERKSAVWANVGAGGHHVKVWSL